MFSLPSSRKVVQPAVIILTALIALWLVLKLNRTIIESVTNRHKFVLPERHELQAALNFENFTSLEDYYLQQYHLKNGLPTPNQDVLAYLSQCRHTLSPYTNHVRLSSAQILNISMVPADDSAPEFASHKYFNPAIIPLPSHVFTTSGYRYLLVSRLVTAGHHQESHICFADICEPESSASHDTRTCTASDLELLGPQGGLGCLTKPERVNIPPTPSRRCTGAWSTFPDIPGFHDPRVFWSGRGEPLIEVNSGSQYGCVGLWLQDLRAVYMKLDEVLVKREKGFKIRDEDEVGGTQSTVDLLGLEPSVMYKYLTEITKNPRKSRSEVEKNWVLFFPTGEETWVQYDMMGQVGPNEARSAVVVPVKDEDSLTEEFHATEKASTRVSTSSASQIKSEIPSGGGHSEDQDDTEGDMSSSTDIQPPASMALETSPLNSYNEPELKEAFIDGPKKRSENAGTAVVSISPETSPSVLLASDPPSDKSTKGGRTLAQLLSNGYTTPNLTSPLEPSCFNFTDHSHLHDSYNNSGHWHQGSNSLRLILCTREQFRARSCSPSPRSDADVDLRDRQPSSWEKHEEYLVRDGLVVHFSIVHRKFNNDWDLPMRYERYILVWEARKPFRTLGISQLPILFGEERARPWTAREDLGIEADFKVDENWKRDEVDIAGSDESEDKQKRDTYFTYTPSITWAWRQNNDEGATQERGHEDLGTGYLGEEIVVGNGMDDVAQGYVKIRIDDLLTCLRLCPMS